MLYYNDFCISITQKIKLNYVFCKANTLYCVILTIIWAGGNGCVSNYSGGYWVGIIVGKTLLASTIILTQ